MSRTADLLSAANTARPDLCLRLAPARVNLENDGSSWRENPPEQAHQWVAVRSTPNVQLVIFGEIELQLGATCPIKRELKFMAPRSGYNGHGLAVSDPCYALVVDQNSP